MNDMLIQEVNDDLRSARMHALWLRVRKPLIVSVALLITVTAGTSIYKHMDTQAKAEATQVLLAGAKAYGNKNYDEAMRYFDRVTNMIGGELGGIAQLWHARSQLAMGKKEEAATSLRNIIAEEHQHPRIHDMACVHLAGLNVAMPQSCDGSAPSPMQSTLGLLHAASLWEQGRIEEAATLLKAMSENSELAEEERALADRYYATIMAHHVQ